MEKVKLINTNNGSVHVVVPQVNFNHEWLSQGATFSVDKDTLEQLMFDPGFAYMINTGMLYIEDMDVKKELGIEPEDASAPVNVIVLSDKERRRYMVNLSLDEFKEKLTTLNIEQINLLADYAIQNRLVDFDKSKAIREICGRDIIQAIRLGDQAKEE